MIASDSCLLEHHKITFFQIMRSYSLLRRSLYAFYSVSDQETQISQLQPSRKTQRFSEHLGWGFEPKVLCHANYPCFATCKKLSKTFLFFILPFQYHFSFMFQDLLSCKFINSSDLNKRIHSIIRLNPLVIFQFWFLLLHFASDAQLVPSTLVFLEIRDNKLWINQGVMMGPGVCDGNMP